MTPAHAAADRKQAGVVARPKLRPRRPYGRGVPAKRAYLNPAQLVLNLEFPASPSHTRQVAGTHRHSGTHIPKPPTPGELFHSSDIALAVMAFHEAFGLPRRAQPTVDIEPSIADLRIRLLEEEVGEFAAATRARDLVAIADALADIAYVTYGAAITYGIDLDAVLSEVHRANMSKLDRHGRPVLRADGKVIKSERYRPPDVAGVLNQQLPLPIF